MLKIDGVVPICWVCQHVRVSSRGRLTCEAFPLAIPRAILDGRVDHRYPFPGDDGIRFQLALDAPAGLKKGLDVLRV